MQFDDVTVVELGEIRAGVCGHTRNEVCHLGETIHNDNEDAVERSQAGRGKTNNEIE